MADLQLHDACDLWAPGFSLGSLEPSFSWAQMLLSAVTVQGQRENTKEGTPMMFRDQLQVMNFRGAIFTGSAGNGRHTTAEALACSLRKKGKDPKVDMLQVRVFGADLDYESPDEALAAMASVARAARDSNGLILTLDEPQDCRHSRMIQTKLLRLLERSNFPLYLIIVTDRLEGILPGLRRHLMLCHCTKPTCSQRREWLADQLRKPYKILPEDASVSEIAKETEGFSWNQLRRLVEALRYRLFWNAKLETDRIGEQEAAQIEDEAEKLQVKKKAGSLAKRKGLMEKGTVCPTEEEYEQIFHSIKEQEAPPETAPAFVSVPMMAGQTAAVVAAQQSTPEPSEENEEDQMEKIKETIEKQGHDTDEIQKKIELHSHPEQMDGNTLLDTLGLHIPDTDDLDEDE